MKKFFSNTYVDHAFKVIITLSLGYIIYITKNVILFVESDYPQFKEKMNEKCSRMTNTIYNETNKLDTIFSYKIRNLHIRINNQNDKFNDIDSRLKRMEDKIDFLLLRKNTAQKDYLNKNDISLK